MSQTSAGIEFKCLYRLPCGTVFVRTGDGVLGYYKTVQHAARALAAHLGVDVKDLARRTVRQGKHEEHQALALKGVYKTAGGRFEARAGKRYLGRFNNLASACKEIAKKTGAHPGLSKMQVRVKFAAKCFASAKKTFKTWRPADIKNLIEVRKNHPLFCITPGPLYMLAVAGKEQAWRAAIVRLSEALPASAMRNMCALSDRIGSDEGALRLRDDVAKDVHKILVAACEAMATRSIEEKAYFVKHVNRNVAHHSGWLALMQRMGILSKTNKEDKTRLVFHDPHVFYKTMPFSQKLVAELVMFSRMQQVLLATPPARTLDEWKEGLKMFQKLVLKKDKQDSYSLLWNYRSAMIAERSSRGYKDLEYNDTNTAGDLAAAFPDMSRWVSFFCTEKNRVRLSAFVRLLDYRESIEYLTCDLCIFMPIASELATTSGDCDPQVERCKIAEDTALLREVGDEAHPAVIARQVATLRAERIRL